jgi:hypothetical protein
MDSPHAPATLMETSVTATGNTPNLMHTECPIARRPGEHRAAVMALRWLRVANDLVDDHAARICLDEEEACAGRRVAEVIALRRVRVREMGWDKRRVIGECRVHRLRDLFVLFSIVEPVVGAISVVQRVRVPGQRPGGVPQANEQRASPERQRKSQDHEHCGDKCPAAHERIMPGLGRLGEPEHCLRRHLKASRFAHLSGRSSRLRDLRPRERTPIVVLERAPADFAAEIGLGLRVNAVRCPPGLPDLTRGRCCLP